MHKYQTIRLDIYATIFFGSGVSVQLKVVRKDVGDKSTVEITVPQKYLHIYIFRFCF